MYRMKYCHLNYHCPREDLNKYNKRKFKKLIQIKKIPSKKNFNIKMVSHMNVSLNKNSNFSKSNDIKTFELLVNQGIISVILIQ